MKPRKDFLPDFLAVVTSISAWITAVIATMAVFIFGNLVAFFPALFFDWKRRGALHGVSQVWARTLILLSPVWYLDVRGHENIKPGHRYVIVANHQSIADILVVLAAVKTHFKFIAKKELFKVPFIGWHMSLAGYIPVLRGSKESAKIAVAAAKRLLQLGVSVLFFPEGTRSLDGQIHTFKTGAFRVAAEEGVEILPVVIEGTGEAIPKHSWIMRKSMKFYVRIGKPVPPPVQQADQVERVRREVQAAMAQELEILRKQTIQQA